MSEYSLDELLSGYEELVEGPEFDAEKLKNNFASMLEKRMIRNGLKKKELADKLHTSAAYVSGVLRGDKNLTIETMVKLADAVGGKVNIHISDNGCDVRFFDVYPGSVQKTREAAKEWTNLTEKVKRNEREIRLAA